MMIFSAAVGFTSVGGDLRGFRADFQEEATFIGGLSGAQVFDFDGIGGKMAFFVVNFDFDKVMSSCLRARGQSSCDGEVSQGDFA
jgi:hypothetical protein